MAPPQTDDPHADVQKAFLRQFARLSELKEAVLSASEGSQRRDALVALQAGIVRVQ